MKHFPETLTSALAQAEPAAPTLGALATVMKRPTLSSVWDSVRVAAQDVEARQVALRASALRAPR